MIKRPKDTQEVHFHQGPQAQPVPCYDGKNCPSPKLSLAEARR